jgi:hypothetical protein
MHVGANCGQRWFSREWAGVAQLARVSAFQAEGCGFETRLPLQISSNAPDFYRPLGLRSVSKISNTRGSSRDGSKNRVSLASDPAHVAQW